MHTFFIKIKQINININSTYLNDADLLIVSLQYFHSVIVRLDRRFALEHIQLERCFLEIKGESFQTSQLATDPQTVYFSGLSSLIVESTKIPYNMHLDGHYCAFVKASSLIKRSVSGPINCALNTLSSKLNS